MHFTRFTALAFASALFSDAYAWGALPRLRAAKADISPKKHVFEKRRPQLICKEDEYFNAVQAIPDAPYWCAKSVLNIPDATITTVTTPPASTVVIITASFPVRQTVIVSSTTTVRVTATAYTTVLPQKRAPKPTPAPRLKRGTAVQNGVLLAMADGAPVTRNGTNGEWVDSISSACSCLTPGPAETTTVTETASARVVTQFARDIDFVTVNNTQIRTTTETTTVTLNVTATTTSTPSRGVVSSVVATSLPVQATGLPIVCPYDNDKIYTIGNRQLSFDYHIYCNTSFTGAELAGSPLTATSEEECAGACNLRNLDINIDKPGSCRAWSYFNGTCSLKHGPVSYLETPGSVSGTIERARLQLNRTIPQVPVGVAADTAASPVVTPGSEVDCNIENGTYFRSISSDLTDSDGVPTAWTVRVEAFSTCAWYSSVNDSYATVVTTNAPRVESNQTVFGNGSSQFTTITNIVGGVTRISIISETTSIVYVVRDTTVIDYTAGSTEITAVPGPTASATIPSATPATLTSYWESATSGHSVWSSLYEDGGIYNRSSTHSSHLASESGSSVPNGTAFSTYWETATSGHTAWSSLYETGGIYNRSRTSSAPETSQTGFTNGTTIIGTTSVIIVTSTVLSSVLTDDRPTPTGNFSFSLSGTYTVSRPPREGSLTTSYPSFTSSEIILISDSSDIASFSGNTSFSFGTGSTSHSEPSSTHGPYVNSTSLIDNPLSSTTSSALPNVTTSVPFNVTITSSLLETTSAPFANATTTSSLHNNATTSYSWSFNLSTISVSSTYTPSPPLSTGPWSTGTPASSSCPAGWNASVITATVTETIFTIPERPVTAATSTVATPMVPSVAPRRRGELASPAQISAACAAGRNNLVRNPGFENQNGNEWAVVSSAGPASFEYFESTSQRTPGGSVEGLFTLNSSDASITLSQPLTVCPGEPYIFEFFARQESDLSECSVVAKLGDETLAEDRPTLVYGRGIPGFYAAESSQADVSVDLTFEVTCEGSDVAPESPGLLGIDDVSLTKLPTGQGQAVIASIEEKVKREMAKH